MINKKAKKFLNDNCIDIKKFLMCYCNIYNYEILQNKLSHKDIKKLFPLLKRYGINEVLKNMNGIYIGDIVLVKDSYRSIVPYENPKIKEYSNVLYEEVAKKVKKEIINDILETEKLSVYELRILCQKLKGSKKMSGYYSVHRKYIEKKEEENPNANKYKIKKMKLNLKVREYNDKY